MIRAQFKSQVYIFKPKLCIGWFARSVFVLGKVPIFLHFYFLDHILFVPFALFIFIFLLALISSRNSFSCGWLDISTSSFFFLLLLRTNIHHVVSICGNQVHCPEILDNNSCFLPFFHSVVRSTWHAPNACPFIVVPSHSANHGQSRNSFTRQKQ